VKEKRRRRRRRKSIRKEREERTISVSFLFLYSYKKKNYSTSIVLWVIVMVTSMNRYYFNEVFKQISSKIDQLKTFLPPTTHLQVNIKEKQIYPFS